MWIDTPESSNIARFIYQDETLIIEFKKSGVYSYKNVPYSVFEEMVAAESKGKFFAQRVKNQFQFERHP